MKIFFAAINSSYSHSCPALFALKRGTDGAGFASEWAEWTIHAPRREVLADLYASESSIFAFSVYVWNVEYIVRLVTELRKMRPEAKIILGGPEATGQGRLLLNRCPDADCLCQGEGESLIPRLMAAWQRGEERPALPGLLWQGQSEVEAAPCAREDFSSLPFLYTPEDLSALEGKILYYESSRGCPHECVFCASAREPLRFRPLDLVKEELKLLAETGGQIKFVDRTFNADPQRGAEIIRFVLELYRPGLSWHFEIFPYTLPQELIQALMAAPPGYFRLEAGLQSLHPPTLQAVRRRGDWPQARENLRLLLEKDNLHLHVDLIAGLPDESWESFSHAFDEAHHLAPHYLQLGFLKVLPGSPMAESAADLGLVYSPYPPYQIISTSTLSAGELLDLGRREEMVHAFYNCRRFRQTLYQMGRLWPGNALALYGALADERCGRGGLSLLSKAEVLLQTMERLPQKEFLKDVLLFDYCLYGTGEAIPAVLREQIKGQTISLQHRPVLGERGLYHWEPGPVKLKFTGGEPAGASGRKPFYIEKC